VLLTHLAWPLIATLSPFKWRKITDNTSAFASKGRASDAVSRSDHARDREVLARQEQGDVDSVVEQRMLDREEEEREHDSKDMVVVMGGKSMGEADRVGCVVCGVTPADFLSPAVRGFGELDLQLPAFNRIEYCCPAAYVHDTLYLLHEQGGAPLARLMGGQRIDGAVAQRVDAPNVRI
jgi:hypothetical protein